MNKRKCFLLSILILISLVFCGCEDIIQSKTEPENNTATSLTVTFIDVGQGDCTLIEANGESMLIDCGEKEYADVVIDRLEKQGIAKLDYAMVTHPHTDHYGGMGYVLDEIPTKNFIYPGKGADTYLWDKIDDELIEAKTKVITAHAGDTLTVCGLPFKIFAPQNKKYEETNDYSIVSKLVCGEISFLFTGDSEKLSEYEMLSNGYDLTSTVLKVGHHGSTTSTCEEFLFTVNPSYAVISCGKDNRYGHPHDETIELLNLYNVQVLRTDELGSITAKTDGYTVKFYSDDELFLDSAKSTESTSQIYIGNKKSKVFHLETCEAMDNMKDKNKVEFSKREEAVNSGYAPCKNCNP